MQGRSNAGYVSRPEDTWPDDNDPGHDKPSMARTVPHFLCRSIGVDEVETSGTRWMTGDAMRQDNAGAEIDPAEKFSPLSPHLRGMISRHVEPGKRHQAPAWAEDHYVTDGRRVVRSLVAAGLLVLACGAGLGIAVMQIQGKNAGFKSTWQSVLSEIWPNRNDQQKQSEVTMDTKHTAAQAAAVAVPLEVQRVSKNSPVRPSVSDARVKTQSPIALPLAAELVAVEQHIALPADPQTVVIEPAAKPAINSRNYSGEATVAKQNRPGDGALAMRARGDETLGLGDVVGARGFFRKALQLGDPAAAGRIGRTYDPVIYQVVGVHGLTADARMAERWYRYAIAAGDADARTNLDRLAKHQNK